MKSKQPQLTIHNCEQKTPEWFGARKLKMTASNAQAIGNNGKGLETYITELIAEYLSSADKETFVTKDTERGNELETFARSMYELETGNTVEQVGFIQQGEYVGCSPDGLIGEDGGLEIKCHNDVKHYRLMRDGENELDSAYKWQCQMNMLITGRKWWDLVAYNPNFKQSLLIFRQTPDKEMQDKLIKGLTLGEEMIKNQLKQFNA